jgi:hypothetical protein
LFRKNQKTERISYLQNRRGNVQKASNRFNFKPATIITETDYQYDYFAPETKLNNAASNRQPQFLPNARSALTTATTRMTTTKTTPTTTTTTTTENNKIKLESFTDFSFAPCDCFLIRKEGSFNHSISASLGTVSIINEQEPFNDCISPKFDLENFQNTLMDLIEQIPEMTSFLGLLEITTKCKYL